MCTETEDEIYLRETYNPVSNNFDYEHDYDDTCEEHWERRLQQIQLEQEY